MESKLVDRMKRKRGQTRARAAGVGTRRQRGRGLTTDLTSELLKAVTVPAVKGISKTMLKRGANLAANFAADYAAAKVLEELSTPRYKRKQR